MSLVDLGHVQINTAIDGPEGAPWIVLSNSLGATIDMWAPQIDRLTQHYRVLRYDTRGHGGSSTPPGPYGFDDLTADVLALMDRSGIAKADWLGLSMGAMTGIGLAMHHGDRFGRMVFADCRADAPDGFRAMWDDRIGKVRAGGLEAIADGTLATWLTEDWRMANPDAASRIRAMVTGNDPEGYIACCTGLKQLDYLKDLGRIGLPALYIGGANDMGAAPEVMQAMADATPGATYVQIPNAAHVANINQPEAFNAAVAAFLKI